jgi:hypothetical protein
MAEHSGGCFRPKIKRNGAAFCHQANRHGAARRHND